MRPSHRVIKVKRRQVLPECSRLTVGRTVAALRRSRQALVEIENELGNLLACLHEPNASIDLKVPDRLASAKSEATLAMAGLEDLGRLFG